MWFAGNNTKMRIGQSFLPTLNGGIRSLRFNTTSATASCLSRWLYRSAQGCFRVLPFAYKNGMQRRSLQPSLNAFQDMQRCYVTGTWAARTIMPGHARTLLPCFFWKEHRTFTSEAAGSETNLPLTPMCVLRCELQWKVRKTNSRD